jgi:glycine dehydrogenase
MDYFADAVASPALVAPESILDLHAFKSVTAVETGAADAKINLLKNASHNADQVSSDNWNRPYSREAAAFPAKSLHDYKFWPVARVDNVFGDRNPVCSCVGMENYS